MKVNFRKGDIVRDTLDDAEKWVGLVVGVKGQVAEVYYPQHSGRLWLPFNLLEKVDESLSSVGDIAFLETS